jgi:outer membrane immunogenic protein
MLRQFLTAAGGLLAICPVAAPAQDIADPVSTRAMLLAGPRAELIGGYEESASDSGFLYGVRLGYDFSIGRSVALGIEGEAANSTLDNRSTFDLAPDIVTTEADLGRTLYAGGRIAVAVAPRVSIYGRAGYVNRRVSGRIEIVRTSPAGPGTLLVSQRFQSFFDGIRLGVGTQARLTGNLYGGVEYRFDTYGGELADSHQTALSLGLRF